MCADHWRWQRSNPDGYQIGELTPSASAAE
jgi:hypothetical protein